MTGNDLHVLPGIDQAGLAAVENLVDDDRHVALARALLEARTWQRIARASGAWIEEVIADRRHGQALLRGGRPFAAVIPLIRARAHDLAAQAAVSADWVDVTRFLRGNPLHRRAACAVAAAQADLVPNERIDELTNTLLILARGDDDPAKDAQRALAAFAPRLPEPVAHDLVRALARAITRRGTLRRPGSPACPGCGGGAQRAASGRVRRRPARRGAGPRSALGIRLPR